MKKLSKNLIVLTVMFLLIGCIGLETKREALPNGFTDSRSGLNLKIEDGFVYKGNFTNAQHNLKATNTDGAFHCVYDYHVWKRETSHILVLFKTLKDEGSYWNRLNINSKKWNAINLKEEKLGGKKWVTGFQTLKLSSWQREEANKLGINFEKSIAKMWLRNSRSQTQIWIYYTEKSNMRTRKIKKRGYMTDLDRTNIKNFEKRADAAIRFTK